MTVQLFCGDCLEIMPTLGKVDAVICDPPYAKTQNGWDTTIPLEPMWNCLKKAVKSNGPIVLFGQNTFTFKLGLSNEAMFRYSLVWEKTRAGGFLNANRMPLQAHEDILIFYAELPTYNPQYECGRPYIKKAVSNGDGFNYGKFERIGSVNANGGIRFPRSVVLFSNDNHNSSHPTQKPVELMEYLIKTYTQERETVLDFTCGSGSTGVAAVNLGRSFIGIEKDPRYFEIAKERIAEAERRKNNEFFVKKPTAPTLFDFMLEANNERI